MSLTSYAREPLKVMASEYYIEDTGSFTDEPIVELYCRNAEGERRSIEVEGFHPYFWITKEAYEENEDTLLNESAVRRIEVPESLYGLRREKNEAVQLLEDDFYDLHDKQLVKVVTVVPGDTPDLRDWFHKNDYDTYEADVFFTDRFAISNEIFLGVKVPHGETRVSVEELEPCEAPDVKPRMLTADIEVLQDGEFPEPTDAAKPVTAITAHDSYTDDYVSWILEADEWPDIDKWNMPDGVPKCDVRVFDDEAEMLGDFNEWVVETDPDIMTGWNSSRNDRGNGFDYPYLINRCFNINEWSVRDIAKDEDTVFVSNRGSAVVAGRELMDMMQAYMKTQIHEKRSYALDYIADDELGYGKEDVDDLDEAWKTTPVEFLKYNIRDVQAVVEIEETKSVIDMYDHIRGIAGASYTEIADSNIGIIDILYLRQAFGKNIALPTSRKPDVQHYWGAYVFEPEAGLHRNVVYPDLASLYPNLFKDMNASPETIIGFEEDLQESEYTKDDCHRIYVDERDEGVKKEADEPNRSELYVLKPEVEQSFVREVIEDLIDMKYEYKKDEYDKEAYAAVKRITNSVYGCMGDSKSYGKGFRLFDWRIAEAITLAGRDVIKYTADTFEEFVQKEYPESRIIAGDTDSCVCTIPGADGMEETLDVAQRAAEYVDQSYDEFMSNRYWMDENSMEVEIESYAESAFFMSKKKRYAQWIRWDEGDLVDEVEIKGLELVRSDSSQVTQRVQKKVLDLLLKSDTPKEDIKEFLTSERDAILNGNVTLDEIGIPKSINKELSEYGYVHESGTKVAPQPHIRGAKYANKHIDGESMSSGSKPLMYYVEAIRDEELPETYSAETGEDGDVVDAISVEDSENIPSTIRVDYDEMCEKVLQDPNERIFEAAGWTWSDMTSQGSQSNLASFM